MQRDNAKKILKAILEEGGELALVVNRLSRYKLLDLEKFYYSLNRFYYVVKRMKASEIINIGEKDGQSTIFLTKKGKITAIKYSLENLEIKKPKKWDKKWRIVIFDIPDKRKVGRNVLKNKLKELGFEMLQKSVYVHPFSCEDEIDFVRVVYKVKPFVRIIVADKIENGELIKKRFGIN